MNWGDVIIGGKVTRTARFRLNPDIAAVEGVTHGLIVATDESVSIYRAAKANNVLRLLEKDLVVAFRKNISIDMLVEYVSARAAAEILRQHKECREIDAEKAIVWRLHSLDSGENIWIQIFRRADDRRMAVTVIIRSNGLLLYGPQKIDGKLPDARKCIKILAADEVTAKMLQLLLLAQDAEETAKVFQARNKLIHILPRHKCNNDSSTEKQMLP